MTADPVRLTPFTRGGQSQAANWASEADTKRTKAATAGQSLDRKRPLGGHKRTRGRTKGRTKADMAAFEADTCGHTESSNLTTKNYSA